MECTSCAARVGEARFPESRPRGTPVLCEDCHKEARRKLVPDDKIQRKTLITLRSWRNRERARRASPQMDMLDWLQG
jgi:hypothetical protein